MKQAAKGISLLEILITLAVIGILALVTVPQFSDYFLKARVQSAAEALYHDFQKARTEAIKSGQNAVTVVFQDGTSWCYGMTTASTCNCNTAGSCNLGQTNYASYKGTSLSFTGFTTGAGSGDTTFSYSRGDVNRTGTATFSSSGSYSISVELNKMGFSKICSSTVEGYKAC